MKNFLSIKNGLVSCSLILIVIINIHGSVYHGLTISSQVKKSFKIEDVLQERDSLFKLYGNNKYIQKKIELSTLIALSFYPELKDNNIDFIYENIKTTMATRPSPLSVFKQNRDYTIYIDNDPEGEGILIDDVPFNAQIGIIGHELAHIADYESKSGGQIIGIGLRYLHQPMRASFEKEIDIITIRKGLGWQLHDWSKYVLYESNASKEYKEYKQRTYLTPQEIISEISIDSAYIGVER